MRPDGDPERDDYGLPRIDVVIPDDARELERDLLAYRREERRRRRRARARQVLTPFGRIGIAVPLVVGALLIAMVSGTLLTVFGPRPAPRRPSDPVAGNPSAGPGQIGGVLPDGMVAVGNGKGGSGRPVDLLRGGVIGIVPPGCRCRDVVSLLAAKTRAHPLKFWLVADRRAAEDSPQQSLKELRLLAGAAHETLPVLVQDQAGVLARAYGPPAGTKDAGLTAVLVHTDGVVADVIRQPTATAALDAKLDGLRTASLRQPG